MSSSANAVQSSSLAPQLQTAVPVLQPETPVDTLAPASAAKRTAPPGMLRALTEPARRYLPGHDERHSRRQALHEGIFAAVDASRSKDPDALAAWKAVVSDCKANNTSVAQQINRCSDSAGEHILDTLLNAGDYDSLDYLAPHLAGPWVHQRFGKVWVSNADGRLYIGETRVQSGKRQAHGRGLARYSDGRLRYGEWQDNYLHGKGTVVSSDGKTRWDGFYADGYAEGHGTSVSTAQSFDGGWKQNKRHGPGTITYSNGQKVSGIWVDGKITNFVRTRKDGSTYEGAVDEDWRAHGQGKSVSANGAVYKGTYRLGDRHGDGEQSFEPGHALFGYKYIGPFVNDKAHGSGALQNIATGENVFAHFLNGALITAAPPPMKHIAMAGDAPLVVLDTVEK